jgi:hypothetical protein
MERCDDCGFVWDLVVAAELPSRLAEAGARFRRLLLPHDRPTDWAERLRTRPGSEVWSPIEYACHVRDVLLVQRDRLYRGLVEQQPPLTPMWREERTTLAAYANEDAGEVVAEIEFAANLIARSFAAVPTIELERTVVYFFPKETVRTLTWLGAQTAHEAEHHWRDIAAQLAPQELGIEHVRRSPSDAGPIELIVRRPAVDEREIVDAALLDVSVGLVGDSWTHRPSRRTPDRSPHPDAQLTLMNSRAAALVAGSRDRWPLVGDQIYVDLDLSEANLRPGARLAIGDAVVEISAEPHRGCQKFSNRFGASALRLVNSATGRELRLRGVNARVVESGSIRPGDLVKKLTGA